MNPKIAHEESKKRLFTIPSKLSIRKNTDPITDKRRSIFPMKTIILARHAKSSWKDPGLDDFDRPLNKRGKRNAIDMVKKNNARSYNSFDDRF